MVVHLYTYAPPFVQESEALKRLDLTNLIEVLTKQLQRGVQQSKVTVLLQFYSTV